MRAGAVLDAWAVLALLQREASVHRVIQRYLRRAHSGSLRLLLCWINLGEVYYRLIQSLGEERGGARLALIRTLPVELVPVREPLVLEAARLKARHRVSCADAFAVATARLEGLPLLTGDPEILALPRDVVRVRRLER
ncbi:MAG: type II toxin-antitoxin system VapC family toxin [Deltaproteobacteria bacterium]|nr:type II toxin-antitoxin system VapC family toxin [Deltaproteobacteria bacterium]